jgi:AcrR family transcriptional regulator
MRRSASGQDRLLESALIAFAAHGFAGASTHAIAEEAGAQQGLIRHHFGSKEGLWSAVVDRGVTAVLADLDALGAGLTVAGWIAIAERHAALAAVLLHAGLEGGERAGRVAEKLEPLLGRLLAFQRRAEPHAALPQLVPWLAASLGPVLLRHATGSGRRQAASALPLRAREVDRLFAWLTATHAPQAVGPFAVHAARAQLRG